MSDQINHHLINRPLSKDSLSMSKDRPANTKMTQKCPTRPKTTPIAPKLHEKRRKRNFELKLKKININSNAISRHIKQKHPQKFKLKWNFTFTPARMLTRIVHGLFFLSYRLSKWKFNSHITKRTHSYITRGDHQNHIICISFPVFDLLSAFLQVWNHQLCNQTQEFFTHFRFMDHQKFSPIFLITLSDAQFNFI